MTRWTEQQLAACTAARAPAPAAMPTAKGTENPSGLNKLEQRYADELESQLQRGEIAYWKAHPFGLRLADKTFYHPDFLVMLADGTLEVHETKGFMRDDANVKLKVAASQFPFVFRLVMWKEKTWQIRAI